MGRQRRQVVGVVVHVVTVAGLGGASVPPAVMGDNPIALLQEEQQLGVPIVARKGPAMTEDDRLARAPILVEDLRAIRCGDRAHARLPPLIWTLAPSPRIASLTHLDLAPDPAERTAAADRCHGECRGAYTTDKRPARRQKRD